MPSPSRTTFVTLFFFLVVASGCSSAGRDVRNDPDLRLAELLEEWQDVRAISPRAEANVDPQISRDVAAIPVELDRLLLEYPNHSPSLEVAAEMAFARGDWTRAERYATRRLALPGASPRASVIQIQLALKNGNRALARELCDRAIRLRPDDVRLCESSAGVAYLSGDYELATAELSRCQRLGGDRAKIEYHRGLVAEAQGNMTLARRHYDRCLEANPEFAPAKVRQRALRDHRN